jgi:hypothetical protein
MPGLFYLEMLGLDKISFSNQHSQKLISIFDTGTCLFYTNFFYEIVRRNTEFCIFVAKYSTVMGTCNFKNLCFLALLNAD